MDEALHVDEGLEVMDDEHTGPLPLPPDEGSATADGGALYGSAGSGFWERGEFHFY